MYGYVCRAMYAMAVNVCMFTCMAMNVSMFTCMFVCMYAMQAYKPQNNIPSFYCQQQNESEHLKDFKVALYLRNSSFSSNLTVEYDEIDTRTETALVGNVTSVTVRMHLIVQLDV